MLLRRNDHLAEQDLSAYLDAQLSGSALERCEAHLGDCPACRDALEGLRAVRSSLRALPRASAPRSFRLREAEVGATRPRMPWTVRAVPLLSGVSAVSVVAFIVMIGVSAGGGWSLSSSDSDGSAGGSSALMSAQDSAATSEETAREYSVPDAEAALQATPPGVLEGESRNVTSDDASDDGQSTAEKYDAPGPATGNTVPEVPGVSTETASSDDDDNRIFWIAQAIVAAIALGSGGLAFAAWRRTR